MSGMRVVVLAALAVLGVACSTGPSGEKADGAGQGVDGGVVIGRDGSGEFGGSDGGGKPGDAGTGDDGGQQGGCKEGARSCASPKEVVECQNGNWVTVAVCPETHFCAGGACVKSESCEPGEIKGCYSLDSMSQCNEAGTGFEPVKCAEGEKCANGACADFVCFPGQAICVDSKTKQNCLNDGSGWDNPEACPSGLTCVGGKCLSECLTDPKWNNSYIGCEYWSLDLDNYHDPFSGTPPDEAIHGVVLGNPGSAAATVTFTSYATDVVFNLLQTTIEAGEVKVIPFPRMDVDGPVITSRSVRINSNRPVVAYQFNPLDFQSTFSDDSSLLLPAEMLGKEYLILSYPTTPLESMPIMGAPSQHGYFTVLAIEMGKTKVTVKVTARTDYPGQDGKFMKPGEVHEFELEQGQVINFQADGSKMTPIGDLSGSHVIADRKVVVFSGHEEAVVQPPAIAGEEAPDCCCAEHLEEQLFPLDTWDSHYICAKSPPRGGVYDQDLWRIQAGEAGVTISTDPAIPGLDGKTLQYKGDWVEAFTDKSFIVDATGPIQAAQYIVSQGCTDMFTGDPALVMAVSASQYRGNYVFAVPKDYNKDYISVVKPAGGAVTLDGQVLADNKFSPIAGGDYLVGYFEVADGPHAIEGDKSFGLFQYGFSGPASYGHMGGLNLIKKQ